jgi:hypothetical protein
MLGSYQVGGTSGAGYVFPSEMPRAAFAKYAAQAQAATDFVAPPLHGRPADWTVDIWNWGVPEGRAGSTSGETAWPQMIRSYAQV